jgi:hypothetical protein
MVTFHSDRIGESSSFSAKVEESAAALAKWSEKQTLKAKKAGPPLVDENMKSVMRQLIGETLKVRTYIESSIIFCLFKDIMLEQKKDAVNMEGGNKENIPPEFSRVSFLIHLAMYILSFRMSVKV